MKGLGQVEVVIIIASAAISAWQLHGAMKAAREAKRRQRAALAAEATRWQEKFTAEEALSRAGQREFTSRFPIIAGAIGVAAVAWALTPARR